jgi:DNA-binding MarR family transcriptional regulator
MEAPDALTPDEELLWRSLMQLVIRIPRVTDDDFAHDSNLATSEYVVLMHLSEAPEHQLRMTELATRTALSASRITRVVDGLARAGLVVKTRCNDDGRGHLTRITEAGLTRRFAAHSPHLHRVRTRFLDGVPPRDAPVAANVLAQMLDNLLRSLEEHRDAEGVLPRAGSV